MRDFQDVLAFHEKFDLPRATMPMLMEPAAEKFRMGFLDEEAKEFDEGWLDDNLVAAADALFDFVYVAIGTALFIGTHRGGHLGGWPTFPDARAAAVMGEIVSAHGAPQLLPKSLQMVCGRYIRDRVDFFKNAYDAAKDGEPRAIHLALHALKHCCVAAYSTGAMMHLPWENCFRHVQAANMAKQRAKADGSDSKRSTPWDVIKPEGWVAPDAKIAMELELAGWRIPEDLVVNRETGKVYYREGA